MKRFIQTLILFLFPTFLLSQHSTVLDEVMPNQVDSLRLISLQTSHDTARLDAFRRLSEYYIELNRDSALYFAEHGYALAHQYDQKYWAMEGLVLMAAALRRKGDYPRSLQHIFEAIKMAEDPAIEKAAWVLGTKKSYINTRRLMGYAHIELGILYQLTGSPELAKSPYFEVQKLGKALDDKALIAMSYMGFGSAYNQMNKLDSALIYLLEGIEAYKLSDYEKYKSYGYTEAGFVYLKKKDYPLAKAYFFESINRNNGQNSLQPIVDAYTFLGSIHKATGNLDSSLFYTNAALKLCRTLNAPDRLLRVYNSLSLIHQSLNHKDSAFSYLQLAVALKDSLNDADKIKTFQNIGFEDKMRLQKLEQEQVQNNNRNRMSALLAGLAGIFFIALILYRNNRLIQKTNQQLQVQRDEINEKNKQIKELDTLKTRLYTNITHEFRTPLTVIMGMVDNIREHQNERELIKRNSNNLLRLINQMLDLSKLDSGNLKAQNVEGDIIQYLQYLTESFYSMAKEKNINLTFYAETKELVMAFDESKIQHIVYNLLSNALKFTKKDGKVIMHALQIEQNGQPFLKLKVQDTGVGIAEKEMPFIFDRFYQADSSNTHQSGGTGIGLALTKELIEWMDGSINVESTHGKGSSFTLLFPVKRENNEKIAPQNPPFIGHEVASTVQKNTNLGAFLPQNVEDKPILLIIEDNYDVVFYMQTILQESFDIRIGRDGKQGVDMALEQIPDIIISDVMMPEKNGYEVCETLKSDERTSHIPIILLTAKSTIEDKITGLKVGADAYLMKPFNKEELLVRVEKLLELRRVLQKRNFTPSVNTSSTTSARFQTVDNDKTSAWFETSPTLATQMTPSVKLPIFPPKAPSLDDIFLEKIVKVIEVNLSDSELSILQLCHAVHLSHTQVFRKLKAITGVNPTLFIRKVRLQKAHIMLKETELNISEIAYETGFTDPNYFSRAFNEEFGETPSAIRK